MKNPGINKLFTLISILILVPGLMAVAFSQTNNANFQDTLLDHFLGKWKLSGKVNGTPVTITLQGEWVLNHQYLRIHESGLENLPGKNYKYEGEFYLGYNNLKKIYTRFLMNTYGAADPASQTYTGYKKGNTITLASPPAPGTTSYESFTWEPKTHTWHLLSSTKKSGQPLKVYLDMRATRLPE